VQGSNGVDVRRLGMIWTEVQKRLGSMSPALDESLAGQLSERTQSLRSALDQTDAGRVSSSYWDFRYVVDQSFYRIDDDLRNLCSKVNEDLRASIAA